jgi:hypothetical protein
MFKEFRIMFIFNLNVVFTMNCLKMALSRVRFCPGFPPGAVISRRAIPSLTTMWGKPVFRGRGCQLGEFFPKNGFGDSFKKCPVSISGLLKCLSYLFFFYLGYANPVRGANCSSLILELRQSIPLRTANSAGAASVEKAIWRGAPPEFLEARWSKFLYGKSCSWRKSRAKKKAHMDWCHLLKFYMKTILKSKINLIRKASHLYNEAVFRPFQSRETIPLNKLLD